MLEIVKGPYLQMPGENTMTILWETSEASTAEVVYSHTGWIHAGLKGNYVSTGQPLRIAREGEHENLHRVTITGLEPGTNYHYRVISRLRQDGRDEEAVLPARDGYYDFRTAVDFQTPFSFAVTSETCCGDETVTCKIFRQMKNYRPDFILFPGDLTEDGRIYEKWAQRFFNPGRELFVNTPFYAAPGNHEYHADWYDRFFSFPQPVNYYSFDYGNAHFTALDSTALVKYREKYTETYLPEEIKPGNAQYDFLVRDLANCQATWKFVFFHYPPYVSGDYQVDAMRALCPVFDQYHVDFVFNSHTIVYERSHPLRNGQISQSAGVTYVVAGGAGARGEWFHHKRSWHTAQALAVPHFIQVVVAGPVLELHAIDCEGNHFDTVRMTKP